MSSVIIKDNKAFRSLPFVSLPVERPMIRSKTKTIGDEASFIEPINAQTKQTEDLILKPIDEYLHSQ